MTAKTAIAAAISIAFTALLGACSSPMPSGSTEVALQGTTWQVQSALVQSSSAAAEMSPPQPPELRLEDGGKRYSGFTGCNRAMGSAQLDADKLQLQPGATTRMACTLDTEATEREFLAALPLVRRWQIQGRVLRLLGEDGQPVLVLRAAPGAK
jgi:putative lipoprotein